jgi:hypothetical protein
MWPKKRRGVEMVRDGKQCENLRYLSVAATFEKAITYVFAESLFPKLEVLGSSPIARSIFILWFQTENSDTFLEPSGSVAHTFDMN